MTPLLHGETFEEWPLKSDCMDGTKKKNSPLKKVVNDYWVSTKVSAINGAQTRSPNDVELCKSGVLKLLFKVMMNCIYWLEAMSRHGPFFKVTLEMELKPCWDGPQRLRQLPKR